MFKFLKTLVRGDFHVAMQKYLPSFGLWQKKHRKHEWGEDFDFFKDDIHLLIGEEKHEIFFTLKKGDRKLAEAGGLTLGKIDDGLRFDDLIYEQIPVANEADAKVLVDKYEHLKDEFVLEPIVNKFLYHPTFNFVLKRKKALKHSRNQVEEIVNGIMLFLKNNDIIDIIARQ